MSTEKTFVFKSLQTYASNEWMANASKKFRSVYDSSELKQIGVVLKFYNTKFFEIDWQSEIQFSCFREGPDESELLFSNIEVRTISNDENDLEIYQKWDPGDDYFWEKGTYKWTALINGLQVGECNFYIENEGAMIVPALNPYFELRDIRLYKGDKENIPMEEREYLKEFNKNDTKYVWVQLEIRSSVNTDWFGEVFYNFLDDTGMLKEQVSSFNYFEAGGEEGRYLLTAGWGAEKPGYWMENEYYVNIVFMDVLIGRVKLVFGDKDEEGYVLNLTEEEPVLATPTMAGADGGGRSAGKASDKEILEQLNSLVGLQEIKSRITEFTQYVDFVNLRKAKGFKEEEDFILHSVFTGNPGTGKTTVVKLLGQVFKQKGLLSKGHVHEVDRAALIGEFIGQTAPLTKKAIEKARGGILFIDEAYMLARDTQRDFGMEALEVIIKEMSDGPGDIAIMAAGYPKEMKSFLEANSGLSSRFRYHYHFEDYTPDELYEISLLAAEKRSVSFTEEASTGLRKLLVNAYRSRDSHFGNGRYANFLIDQAKLKMGIRILEDASTDLSKEDLSTVLPEDVDKLSDKIPPTKAEIPINDVLLKKSLEELNNLLGLENVKQEINELVKLVLYYREMDLDVMNKFSFHTVFSGNPGTGKTTVARIIGNIYKALGILERGHLVETGREGLVAEYVGQTAPKTQKRIEEAMDGVLFIDEAYSLTNSQNGHSFGQEAVEVLLRSMDNKRGRFVLIVAGYPENMHEFLESNPGLQSRFDRTLEFQDYSDEELFRIAVKMLNTEKMYLEDAAELYLRNYMKHLVLTRDKYFGNAREVRKLVGEVIRNQNLRMAGLPVKGRTPEALETVILDDVDDFVVKPVVKRPVVGFKSQKL